MRNSIRLTVLLIYLFLSLGNPHTLMTSERTLLKSMNFNTLELSSVSDQCRADMAALPLRNPNFVIYYAGAICTKDEGNYFCDFSKIIPKYFVSRCEEANGFYFILRYTVDLDKLAFKKNKGMYHVDNFPTCWAKSCDKDLILSSLNDSSLGLTVTADGGIANIHYFMLLSLGLFLIVALL